mmetsp:Transcript_7259/g.13425  ORF Transcript_7259/g.13425 Transcript_7259/m.13425 type:complete len:249 (+) Transcript_7259:754-1500(+)
MLPWNDSVAPAVDDHRGTLHIPHVLIVLKPFVHKMGQRPDAIFEECPHTQEWRHQDQPRYLELCGQVQSRAGANRTAEDLDLLQGKPQHLRHKMKCCMSVADDPFSSSGAHAHSIAWVLYGQHVALELFAQKLAKPTATTQIFCIAVEEDDQEARRFVWKQQARHGVASVWHCGSVVADQRPLWHPNEFPWETVDIVAWRRAREQHTGYKASPVTAHVPETALGSFDAAGCVTSKRPSGVACTLSVVP